MKKLVSVTKVLGIVFSLVATNFSAQAFASVCGKFSGTYTGTMSNSNYTVNATVNPSSDCSSMSIHFYGVDRDYTSVFKLTPAVATPDPTYPGVTDVSAGLYDDFNGTNFYFLSTTASKDLQVARANLTVVSFPNQNKLAIKFLGELLITFDGTRIAN